MDIPSLIFWESPNYVDPGITKSTIEDSRLSELITSNAMSILMHPCSAEGINARQIFIRELEEDKEKYNCCLRLKADLVTLDSCEISRRSSVSDGEKAFKTIRQLKAFTSCIDRILDIKSESPLVKRLQDFWNVENKDYIDGIRADIKEGEALIDSIGEFIFRLDSSGFSVMKNTGGVDYVDELNCICRNLDIKITPPSRMNLRIEGAISDGLELLYPKVFKRLYEIEKKYIDLPERQVFGYKKELDFCYEIIELKKKAEANGIASCYPRISEKICFTAENAHDISLLHKKSEKIVPNDISFADDTKFCFLTGANGGGKTTYLRTVTINLILGVCGCPVFCSSATVYPFKRVMTHFPEDERFSDIGRLVEEQKRIRQMLDIADDKCFILFNETFSGTDDVKGCRMTMETVDEIKKKNALGLFVTHFHEVVKMNLPMLSTMIDENNDNRRMFKIVMKNGGINSSFANDILKKYRLDRVSLENR